MNCWKDIFTLYKFTCFPLTERSWDPRKLEFSQLQHSSIRQVKIKSKTSLSLFQYMNITLQTSKLIFSQLIEKNAKQRSIMAIHQSILSWFWWNVQSQHPYFSLRLRLSWSLANNIPLKTHWTHSWSIYHSVLLHWPVLL